MQRIARICLLVLATLLASSPTLFAQGVTTGAITGTVTDDTGQPVADAEVIVRNVTTGFTSRALTRANGLYLIQSLEVGGPYAVSVSRIGYRDAERTDIHVRLSQSTRVDFQLGAQAVQLGALDITVTRTADFSPTRQGVAIQISDTLVTRVPTFSRDFVDLIKLAPQVVYPASGAASGAGAYNRYNTITIDGANQSERFNLGSTGGVPGGSASGKVVSLDAVKEFRVMFTPTDVRQGNFAGMLVNAVTKSGTNEFTGGGSFTYRNNADVLGFDLVGEELRASEFDVKQYGFHVGGPIIRDRLHFFVAPEFQQRTRPATGPYYLNGQPSLPSDQGGPGAPAVPLDSLRRIAQIMQDQYGFDVGSVEAFDNENPLTNLFGRLDFQINNNHRLVLRQIYNRSEDDSFSRNANNLNLSPLSQSSGFRLGSNAFSRRADNYSTVGQLYSTFANNWSNELIAGYSRIKDERIVPVQAPEVAVGVCMGGTGLTCAGGDLRSVVFGTEQFSPGNLLEQDIYEVVNNLTIPMGRHTFTVGGRLDHTHIFNNFAQGSFGVYTFQSVDSLAAGQARGYAVGYPNSGNPADIPADFRVQMYSLYAQDQFALTDRLTITGGLRADIPRLLDRPSQNDTITARFAAAQQAGDPGRVIRTDVVPKTRVLWSPRLGFNYDITGDLRHQLRGGIGIYTGPPPYILLGNAYANTGLGLVRLACTSATNRAPAFTLDVNNLPTACAGQAAPAPGQAGTVGININNEDFKYPQYFGVSGGFDTRLPYSTVLTVEGLYRKAINGVLVRDANFRGPRVVNGEYYRDRDGRVLYADTFSVTHGVTTNSRRYITATQNNTSFGEGIIEVANQSKDFNYSLSTQLNRRFSDNLEATLAYTYMKSEDVQSLTSDRAISNWRNGRQLGTDAHEDLVTSTSVFSRPHRLVAYGTYTMPWKITDVTLYYEGSSGVPLSYVAAGDLNGDLYNGNDLLYIPNDATDTGEILIGAVTGGVFTQNAAAAEAFNRFIDSQECLREQRGRIMDRNSCRSPFQHRLDVSVRQSIPQVYGQQLTLQLDFFNFLNFLNSEWGQNKLPTLSPTFNDQRALTASNRCSALGGLPAGPCTAGPLSETVPVFTFNTSLYETDVESSNYLNPKAFEGRTGSVYQVQLTLRYSF